MIFGYKKATKSFGSPARCVVARPRRVRSLRRVITFCWKISSRLCEVFLSEFFVDFEHFVGIADGVKFGLVDEHGAIGEAFHG